MALHAYRFFSRTCRAAFTRYQKVFGGELELVAASQAPEGSEWGDDPDLIMHAELTFGDNVLMGSDDPTGDGGPVKGISISYQTGDGAEAQRVFEALSSGGQVTMPLSETSWSPGFGMCVDEFGTPWMVNVVPEG